MAVLVFRAGQQKKWWQAGIFGLLLALTRPLGAFIFFPTLLAFWQIEKSYKKQVFCLLLIPLGLLAYIFYLYWQLEDGLAFLHGQAAFHRLTGLASLEQMFSAPDIGGKMVLLVDILSGVLAVVAGIFIFINRKYLAAGLYVLLGVGIPILTATWQSMNRYCLVLFPIFIVLALLTKKYWWLHYIYLFLAPLILAAHLIQFVHYAWAG